MNNVSMNPLAALLEPAGVDRPLFEGTSGTLSLTTFRRWVANTRDVHGEALAGKRVAIEAESIAEFCVCLFAIWASSGTVVLLPGSGTALHAASQGDRSRCDVVIKAAPCPDDRAGTFAAQMSLSRHAALILYTSGSTGEPKQICKTLQQLQDEQERLQPLIASAYAGALVAGTVSPQHFYGLVFLVLAALVNGGVILDSLLEGLSGTDEFSGGKRKRVLVSSPAILDRWTELACADASKGEALVVLSAGGQLRKETRNRFCQIPSSTLIEIYGSSETGVIARRLAGPADEWTPLPGVEVISLGDEGTRVVSSYADGGSTVLGDAVTVDPETGLLQLHGRLDRTVKVEERRLSLPGMEALLLAHPLVSDAACCALRPDGALRVIIGAAIVVRTPDGVVVPDPVQWPDLIQSLRALLSHEFHGSLLPRQWRFVEAIPRSTMGKIVQPAVLRLFRSS